MTVRGKVPGAPGLAGAVVGPPVAVYATRLGDDALIMAQRLGGWITNAPQLEEDVALANLGLDLLGQARMLLTYAGEREGLGRDEDDLAYCRDERGFCNVTLVERVDADFGEAMARLLVFSAYQLPLYRGLSASADPTLAAIAAKAVKEVAYHRDHATQWVLRLGDGTPESHRRMQAGVDSVWPHVDELFETDALERALVTEGVAVDRPGLRAEWETYVHDVLRRATLTVPEPAAAPATGGRSGVHTEAMGYLLAELQHLVRSHPGARW
ncbi:1,2-phenylacetyl-CoA epoxidase subunit PaaC [Actinopolymorpha singaporensis]|uniref:Ring-1,2-phenylacetyl-CoA epoxidase subunit PaaC n=1 Tax=Actinopolymorpha singaporensis TaxID=117157 RepID=A0A1H1XW89_9ACTN|nr:1,2-phenylacetyl-CoA epoxidase subunit PaaC [Actinopolymorpha singaporensis]SDT13548.1 ring-1,2-phenylacetyl-CoA epoxidase subunit PaaC [Actinopolymorpha singaporensis]